MKMTKLAALAAFTIIGTASIAAQAATFSGKLVGHHCAHGGKSCPVSKLDPHLALERDFVLVKPDGTYLFLPNVPRDVKVRHALENVTLTGKLNKRYNMIDVEEFKAGKEVSWSKAQEQEEYDDIYNSGD